MSGADLIAKGTLVHDKRRDRVGVVMDRRHGRLQLRPAAGGCEWDARPEDVEIADRGDELRSRVAELNAASRWGL